MRRSRWMTAAACGVATLAATVVPGAQAQAAPFGCLSGNQSTCAVVTGIDAGSRLQLHNGPSYSGGVVPGSMSLHDDDWFVLQCWTTGEADADGNGDHYWFKGDFAGGPSSGQPGASGGWVNDWYLTTGSPSQWQPVVPHC